MAKKTLKQFARQQAAEEQESTPPAPAEEAPAEETPAEETPAEEEAESEEEAGSEEEAESEEEAGSEEETEIPDGSEGGSASAEVLAGALPPGHVGVNAADLRVLSEKAAKWDANEGNFRTLQTWYDNTVKIGASAKEDQNSQQGKKPSSTASQPWNKAAIDLSESL